MNQLLRQKIAGDLLDSGINRTRSNELRERLRNGETLEIGGYAISPRLASDLEHSHFTVDRNYSGHIEWFELTSAPSRSLSPAAQTTVAALRTGGIDVDAMALEGPGFWQSAEIEICDTLIQASLECLAAEHPSGLPGNAITL